jgi:4-amino-4-deoxy-L-arabinose transferase-like glycosyltransferase
MNERLDDLPRGRIAYDGTPTPVKTALFLVICATWLLPGLVGHDPWKVDEATTFGVVMQMLQSGDWIAFGIAGEPFPGHAPLYYWVATLSLKLFGWLFAPQDAARLTSGLFMAGTFALVAAASFELMGERAMRASALLLLGCVGLLARAHEMIPDLAGVTGLAMALYGLAVAERRPAYGGIVTGLGAGIAFLGGGFLPLGMVVMLLALLPVAAPLWRTRRYAASLGLAVAVAAPLVAAWLFALHYASPALLHDWLGHATGGRLGNPVGGDNGVLDMFFFLRILPWYAWPAWPLAAWTLWRSRRTLAARRDLLLPLTAFAAFLIVLSVFGEPRDINAIGLLLPLAILGVAELDTLPRGAAGALDWFGVTTFFLFAALLWVAWFAALTGKPEFAAAMIRNEVPNYHTRFNFLAVSLAALLTLMWCAVVVRSLRSPRRALVNWAAGITMVWMLVMTLGVPLIDQARSYRELSARLMEHLPSGHGCVARSNVGDAQRALLEYFVGLRTVALERPESARCQVLLVQAAPQHAPVVPPGWTEVWRGKRPGDRNELFILFHRD